MRCVRTHLKCPPLIFWGLVGVPKKDLSRSTALFVGFRALPVVLRATYRSSSLIKSSPKFDFRSSRAGRCRQHLFHPTVYWSTALFTCSTVLFSLACKAAVDQYPTLKWRFEATAKRKFARLLCDLIKLFLELSLRCYLKPPLQRGVCCVIKYTNVKLFLHYSTRLLL